LASVQGADQIPHEKIRLGRRPHRVAAAQRAIDHRSERDLQSDEEHADESGDEERAQQDGALLDRVTCAQRLRGERHVPMRKNPNSQ